MPWVYSAVSMGDQDDKHLVGTWRLTSVETRTEDGSVFRRGRRKGYLIYSGDG
jgi:hypothetical protein